MGDPTGSKATTGLALGIFEALKPPDPDLPILGQGEDVIEGDLLDLFFKNIQISNLRKIHLVGAEFQVDRWKDAWTDRHN
jgi:hypothetical protein